VMPAALRYVAAVSGGQPGGLLDSPYAPSQPLQGDHLLFILFAKTLLTSSDDIASPSSQCPE